MGTIEISKMSGDFIDQRSGEYRASVHWVAEYDGIRIDRPVSTFSKEEFLSLARDNFGHGLEINVK